MGYVLTAVIILAVALTAAGAVHVRNGTRPVSRPRRVVVRRAASPGRRRFVRHPILRPPAGLRRGNDTRTPPPPAPPADRPQPPP
jgi:hypothetical protein